MSCAKIMGTREKREREKKRGRLGRQRQTKPPLCICVVLEGRVYRGKSNNIKEGRQWIMVATVCTTQIRLTFSHANAYVASTNHFPLFFSIQSLNIYFSFKLGP